MLTLSRDLTQGCKTVHHHAKSPVQRFHWCMQGIKFLSCKNGKEAALFVARLKQTTKPIKTHERCLQRQTVLSIHSRDARDESRTYHAKRLAWGWMSRAVSPLTIWRTFMDSGIRGSKNRTSPFTLPTHEFHIVRLYPNQILKPRKWSHKPVCELPTSIRKLG